MLAAVIALTVVIALVLFGGLIADTVLSIWSDVMKKLSSDTLTPIKKPRCRPSDGWLADKHVQRITPKSDFLLRLEQQQAAAKGTRQRAKKPNNVSPFPPPRIRDGQS